MFFRRKKAEKPMTKPLYGVNLGGWLVLEKWMTPSLFTGIEALDEYTYCLQSGLELLPRLKRHRDTFITEFDFEWLKAQGIEAVRLPVGYWVFGDEPPYMGTIEYVDKAFDWADRNGMKILLDLHGAPGSQNGKDHSGRLGKKRWHTEEAHIIKTLDVLTRLTKRYKSRPSLLGIELLNEPGWLLFRGKLFRYYDAAYRMIRNECGSETWVVFSDFFPPRKWRRGIRRKKYGNLYLDRHHYQAYSRRDKRLGMEGHMRKTLKALPKALQKMRRRQPVIIGEWSLALDSQTLKGFNNLQQHAARRAYAAAQLIAFENIAGWFYWSYKTDEGGVWSFRDAVENGWLPKLK